MEQQQIGTVALVQALAHAKAAENAAKAERISAEERLIDALKFEKPEGSETYTLNEERTMCKVTLTRPVTRSVDSEGWHDFFAKLDASDAAAVEDLMRLKYELSTSVARKLEGDRPSLWRKCAKFISSKPGKVSVEIKEIVTL